MAEKKEDIELEKIRAKKFQEIMEKTNKEETYVPFTLTDSNFNETTRRHSLMVVDCWAAWCGPCRMLTPIIDELAEELAGEIAFGKLNVDENPETAKRFNIMGVPTLLIMKEGVEIDRMVGAAPKLLIKNRLKRFT